MSKKKVLIIIDGLEETENEFLIDVLKKDVKNTSISIDEKVVNTGVNGFKSESLTCILNILGYPANIYKIYERAYFESIARGYSKLEKKTILRCNIVKMSDRRLIDFTGGISKEVGRMLIDSIQETIPYIQHCSSYKNLIYLDEPYKYIKSIQLPPPHFNIGKVIDNRNDRNIITEIMEKSRKVFGDLGYTNLLLWPWGASKKTTLPSFYIKHGLKGAVVSGIDLVKGIGKALDMEVPNIDDATGDIDTNLENKLEMTFKLLKEKDFVLLHINGCDEAAHRKEYDKKIMFFNRIIKVVIEPLLSEVDNNFEVIVGSDHITNSVTGEHADGKVKFIGFKVK